MLKQLKHQKFVLAVDMVLTHTSNWRERWRNFNLEIGNLFSFLEANALIIEMIREALP